MRKAFVQIINLPQLARDVLANALAAGNPPADRHEYREMILEAFEARAFRCANDGEELLMFVSASPAWMAYEKSMKVG